jgi:hypothetical protein
MKKFLSLAVLCALTMTVQAGSRFRRDVVQVNVGNGVQVNVGRAPLLRQPRVVDRSFSRGVDYSRSFAPVYNRQRNVFFRGVDTHYNYGTTTTLRGITSSTSSVTYAESYPEVRQNVVTGVLRQAEVNQCDASTVQRTTVLRQIDYAPEVIYQQVNRYPVVRTVFRTFAAPVRFVRNRFFQRHYGR